MFYYELMEVSDFRNDVILAEACRSDVDKYCKDVTPGGWRRGAGGGVEGRLGHAGGQCMGAGFAVMQEA